ncbi:MAG: hypothetical protein MZV70_08475 [Desulfobacterales bacterium]|nr:hypothetical protein [Desulfobacterales bacterium]
MAGMARGRASSAAAVLIVIQVNGKLRSRMTAAVDAADEALKQHGAGGRERAEVRPGQARQEGRRGEKQAGQHRGLNGRMACARRHGAAH